MNEKSMSEEEAKRFRILRDEEGRIERVFERVKLPVGLIVAEEMAHELVEGLATKLPEVKIPEIRTKTLDAKDQLVRRALNLLDLRAPGMLEELLIKGENKNYALELVTETIRMHKTFDEMEEVSAYLDTIDAFENDNGEYVLHLKDFRWLESCRAAIKVKEPITFSNTFMKYTEFA